MKQRGFEIISKYQEEGLSVPQRATKGAAGYDFQAARNGRCTKSLEVTTSWRKSQTNFS